MTSTLDLREVVNQPAPLAAPMLLGKRLVRQFGDRIISGLITEVEAYQQDDPASHTYRGKTNRNRAMFGEPGHAYIYFTYGMHWCFNIVTDKTGLGSGVLVRSIKIDVGLDHAWQNRYREVQPEVMPSERCRNLTNGPGKVAMALGIDKSLYGINLLDAASQLKLEDAEPVDSSLITQTPRIGLSVARDTPWRWHYSQ